MLREDDIIIAIMGKSGTGKTSACLELKNVYGDRVHMVKSKTTRAERKEDPQDKESHIFCSIHEFVHDLALAVYDSPKGYKSWADTNCFETGKVNIYTIDPIAYKSQLEPYCKNNYISLIPIYIELGSIKRAVRYFKREKSLKGFNVERNLSSTPLGKPNEDFYEIDGSQSLEDVVERIVTIVNKVM